MLKLLAFDYGASSGRGILGGYDGNTVTLSEVHRFSNDPVTVSSSLYWDILRLYHEMKQGMAKCSRNGDKDIASIGIDTWGVDFGLLDEKGNLLGNPYHYRDSRNDGMIEAACARVPKKEIYDVTGIQFLKFNTIYQLLSMKVGNSPILDKARTMLFMPDLFSYFLTGVKATEYTIASTSQMLEAKTRKWASGLIEKLGIPEGILTDIIEPGTVLGSLKADVAAEADVGRIPVVAVCGHDTASAVASVPAIEGRYAYLSSGTWSLMGIETNAPIINDATYRLNYTNEGGINGTIRLLKNIMGLWIYQECKRFWDKTGEALSFDELEASARVSRPFRSFIDPDDDIFYSPGRMPEKIQEYCGHTGQDIPQTKGEIVRCVMESLALKYRMVLEGLEKIAGYALPVIHVVGGGTRNVLLNSFTASSTGKVVIAGPTEATAAGNVLSQLIALKEVAGLKEARMVIRNSFPVKEYLPESKDSWDSAYDKFLKLINRGGQVDG